MLPEIYFLHIPKTAGTSLAGLIRRAYPPEESIPAFNWYQLAQLDRAEVNRYRCFTGHFGTALYSVLDREIPTVTLLRDPLERTVSMMKHSLNKTGRLGGFWAQQCLNSWERESVPILHRLALRRYVAPALGDVQTRSLGVDLVLPRPGTLQFAIKKLYGFEMFLLAAQGNEPMDVILDRAKRRLDSMAVVGTVERFAESVGLICDYLGISMVEPLPQENISRGHTVGTQYRDSGEFSPEWIDRIDQVTVYDRELYTYANQLLDRKLTRSVEARRGRDG